MAAFITKSLWSSAPCFSPAQTRYADDRHLHPAAHRKAERRLQKADINTKGFSDDEKAHVAWHIADMAANNGIRATACAEEMDLTPFVA